jgi:hypothetical protein
VGMRRRAGFILVRRRAGIPWRPGTILAPTPRSFTDPCAGRKKGF